jgi:quinol monooxygenase YgiN
MVVAVTTIPLKPGSADKAKALVEEVAPAALKDIEAVRRVYYTVTDDTFRAFGIWASAEAYTEFAEGGAMAKALEPFKEFMAGPPSKALHDCFFTVEK